MRSIGLSGTNLNLDVHLSVPRGSGQERSWRVRV